MLTCEICGNSERNINHNAKELMFGFADEFIYVECGKCGCLRLMDPPFDMAKYYPDSYGPHNASSKRLRTLTYLLHILKGKYFTGKWRLITNLIIGVFPWKMPIIKPCDNVYNKKILDVGCGNGARLIELAADGFLSLYGVDPNIGDDIVSNSSETDNPYIKKSEIFDVNDKYDIIMFNHSLEHMYEHEKVLLHAKSILTDDGYLIIRFPTVSSTAWSKYREHWYALDPPRHVFLHSLKSIEILAKKCGYEITDIISETVSNITLSKLYRIGLDRKQQRKFLKTPRGILMRVLNLPSKFFAPRVGKSDRIRLYLRKSGGTQDGHKL